MGIEEMLRKTTGVTRGTLDPRYDPVSRSRLAGRSVRTSSWATPIPACAGATPTRGSPPPRPTCCSSATSKSLRGSPPAEGTRDCAPLRRRKSTRRSPALLFIRPPARCWSWPSPETGPASISSLARRRDMTPVCKMSWCALGALGRAWSPLYEPGQTKARPAGRPRGTSWPKRGAPTCTGLMQAVCPTPATWLGRPWNQGRPDAPRKQMTPYLRRYRQYVGPACRNFGAPLLRRAVHLRAPHSAGLQTPATWRLSSAGSREGLAGRPLREVASRLAETHPPRPARRAPPVADLPGDGTRATACARRRARTRNWGHAETCSETSGRRAHPEIKPRAGSSVPWRRIPISPAVRLSRPCAS